MENRKRSGKAEREGFEPSEVVNLTYLANRRTRPLCDLSVPDAANGFLLRTAVPAKSITNPISPVKHFWSRFLCLHGRR
jgi:hypothetical protein